MQSWFCLKNFTKFETAETPSVRNERFTLKMIAQKGKDMEYRTIDCGPYVYVLKYENGDALMKLKNAEYEKDCIFYSKVKANVYPSNSLLSAKPIWVDYFVYKFVDAPVTYKQLYTAAKMGCHVHYEGRKVDIVKNDNLEQDFVDNFLHYGGMNAPLYYDYVWDGDMT